MTSYTTYANSTPQNFTAILNYNNTVTNGLFAPFMLAIIFVTVFMVLYGKGNENALLGASFITTMSCTLLVGTGFMSPVWFFACGVGLLASTVLLPKER